MKTITFKLEALRYYGGVHALAIIAFNDNRGAYTLDGVNDLLKQYEGCPQYQELEAIKNKMLEPGEHIDIQEDDFSGQEEMF